MSKAVQKQMLKQLNESDDDSFNDDGSLILSPLPLKNEVQSKNTSDKFIPKLDLTRAKQIQEINAKRQIQ